MYNQPFLDIDKHDFLANYWQKKPCIFKNAFTEFPDYLSAEELAGLALEDDIESRLIQCHTGKSAHSEHNRTSDRNAWFIEHGPFAAERFHSLSDSHWTLLVQSVDSWVIETQDLLDHFRFIPQWRFDDLMVSYATDQGGVGPHFDNFDVFLIQGKGKRHWRVGHPGIVKQQSEVASGLLQIDDFEALIDIELNSGDMLYIPPKTAHCGLSLGESIGYSVGYRSPETKQLVTLLAQHLQESSEFGEFFEDKYRESANHNNQSEDQLVKWAQNQLQSLSQQPQLLQQILCRHLGHSKLGMLPLENKFNIQSVSENKRIQLISPLSIIWYIDETQLVVCIEGESFIFEKHLITAIEKLANFEACPIKLFKKSPSAIDFPEDLSNLVNRGYVKLIN